MNGTNLAKGALIVPGATAGIDLIAGNTIGNTMGWCAGATNDILHAGNSLINPLFTGVVGAASAGLLANDILKDLGMTESHKTRWLLSALATGAAYVGGTTLAPYLVVGGLSYAIGKHGWKYGKEALNRIGGAAWGLVGGAIKGAKNGLVNGLRGKQFEGTGMGKLNPKILN